MGGGTGGGGGGTWSIGTNAARPLSADERLAIFNAGGSALMPYTPQSGYQDPGEYKGLGDYNRLEQSIMQSRLAPLQQAYELAVQNVDSDMAKRGIYSSGAATRAVEDVQKNFLPAINQATNEAVTQRYGLQSQDASNLNQYNLARSNQNYNAAWMPANYAKDLWANAGQGVIANSTNNSLGGGTSGGWNFMI